MDLNRDVVFKRRRKHVKGLDTLKLNKIISDVHAQSTKRRPRAAEPSWQNMPSLELQVDGQKDRYSVYRLHSSGSGDPLAAILRSNTSDKSRVTFVGVRLAGAAPLASWEPTGIVLTIYLTEEPGLLDEFYSLDDGDKMRLLGL